MTESSPVSIDEVRSLVGERRRFDEWLTALEGRRNETPSHVYERVHGDYIARRDDVLTSLHAHVPGLEELLAELDARARDLGLRSRAEEDERAEAALRHAVGEYDDGKWDEVRQRVESALETVVGEQQALDSQREDVRQLLDSARPPVVVAVPSPEPVAAAKGDVVTDASHVSDEQPTPDDTLGGPDLELAELPESPSTSETPDWLGAMTPAGVPRIPKDAAPRDANVESFRDSGPIDFESPETEEAVDPRSADVFGNASSSGREAREASDSAAAAPEPTNAFDELAFLRSVIDPQAPSPPAPKAPGAGDAQKTLRCTECGTMNLPTEWYCERCGGELAAF